MNKFRSMPFPPSGHAAYTMRDGQLVPDVPSAPAPAPEPTAAAPQAAPKSTTKRRKES